MTGTISNFIIQKLLVLPGVLIALSFHEFGHAFVAYKLGDDSQRYRGRLSLDPLKHIDPIGFLLLLVIGFGWAKPVEIDGRSFKKPRRDDTLVALAGPVMNFITAFLFAIILLIFSHQVVVGRIEFTQTWQIIFKIIQNVVIVNISLMAFNLIPIPPLDGHHIVGNVFGAKVWNFYYKYADILRLVLMAAIILDIISLILGPVVNYSYNFVIYLANLIVNIFV